MCCQSVHSNLKTISHLSSAGQSGCFVNNRSGVRFPEVAHRLYIQSPTFAGKIPFMIRHKGPLPLIASLFSLAGTFTSLPSCTSTVSTITPVVQDITESVYASGVVKAGRQYDVFSPYGGILLRNLVKPGDTVQPGTPLFMVDNTVSSLNSDNARLTAELLREKSGARSNTLMELEQRLRLAGEKMRNDSLLLVRQRNLWSQQVGSQLELEKRELAFKASHTEYESIRLQFDQSKLELEKAYRQAVNTQRIAEKQSDDYLIRSQLQGTVYSVLREPGEWISSQQPIGTLGQSDRFEIELQVDEFDIVRVRKDHKVFISMDSYRGEVFEAFISRIEPMMNPRTRTFRVYARFTKEPATLYPNLSVEANILVKISEKALTIPVACLINDHFVMDANGDTIAVKTGIRNFQWVEIIDGLNENSLLRQPAP